jgi:hypothetical protein
VCGHRLCELIGGECSIAIQRTRGCRANVTAKDVAPEIFDEVRALLPAIDRGERAAAVRLAAIIRREALDNRQLLAHVRIEEPELAPALERLCVRR